MLPLLCGAAVGRAGQRAAVAASVRAAAAADAAAPQRTAALSSTPRPLPFGDDIAGAARPTAELTYRWVKPMRASR
jgi:hypothetical protein